MESNQLPRGGPCPALPSATCPYGCLSLQTVTEIFTRRFSQRRSLIQHSGGFLFLCEVAPLFRGSRFPHEMRLVQPRLVENRVYAYKAYPQAVEDELDRKDTRLVPSRQCLCTVKRPPALLACVYSRALATLHAVRKETTMKTTAVIGSTTNPIPYKGGEMSKQTLREGPMGKENHRREGTDLK